jgi:hypothetical protein
MKNGIERITHEGITYAEVIWSDVSVDHTTFFSPPESSFQFGLLAHKSGFVEPPHYHKVISKNIPDLQQMFVVQKGVIAVEFYDNDGGMFREVILRTGDAILLADGTHAIRVLEDMQCVSVKQGPFTGAENDKVFVEIKTK